MSTHEPLPDLDISAEFIEQNRGANLVKSRHKPGPQTKSQRRKRRAEVYRLHFQEGWPATRIADVLHVDRNTVNADLKLLYDRALNEYNPDKMRLEDYIPKQLFRLESQRDRLCGYLADTKETDSKISIERLIADIDFRLLNAVSKFEYGHFKFWDAVNERINKIAEDEKLKSRYTSPLELYRISVASRKDLDKIKREAGIE